MNTTEELHELTREKSLLELWRLTKHIKSPFRRKYLFATLAAFAIGTLSIFFSTLTVAEIGKYFRDTSTAMFGFAGTIFSLLIAGFAIFATIGTSGIAGALALNRRPINGLEISELKLISLHFVKAFSPFLAFLLFHALVMFVGFSGGPVTRLAGILGPTINLVAASLFMGGLFAAMIHMLIVLSSFLFNVHSSLMTMVRTGLDPSVIEVARQKQSELEDEANERLARLQEDQDGSGLLISAPTLVDKAPSESTKATVLSSAIPLATPAHESRLRVQESKVENETPSSPSSAEYDEEDSQPEHVASQQGTKH